MAGKPKLPGKKESRGGRRKGAGRPKGVIETKPRKILNPVPATVVPSEEIRERWRKAARKFTKEFRNDPEYYMLRLLTDSEVTPRQKLAIFKEYTATFKDPVLPLPASNINIQQNNLGSPQLLEEHPGSAVMLPKLPSDMKPADVIEMKPKEIEDADKS